MTLTLAHWSYLVGMMMADGTLSNGAWRVVQNSRSFLEELQQHFGGQLEVNRIKEGYKTIWQLRFNREFGRGLERRFPELTGKKDAHVVPSAVEFYSFLLGLLDGDGTINVKAECGTLSSVVFLVRQALADSLLCRLRECGWRPTLRVITKPNRIDLYTVSLHSSHGYKLLESMYEASPLRLLRKHQRFISLVPNRPRGPNGCASRQVCSLCGRRSTNVVCRSCATLKRIQIAQALVAAGHSISSVARQMGIAGSSAWHLAHGGQANSNKLP